ncbi:hypothetical protein AB5J56_44345 [Streptomyces sp. R21]|uniref:Uncharacterized protein n=1 Tax=Streptomyces sp. R21 TaxID=3238627 RepID=A0AB39PQD8_9ACTN
MFVEILFVGLTIDRDNVEEALEAAFEDDGETAGPGGGTGRCHLDLESADPVASSEVPRRLEGVLVELGVSESGSLQQARDLLGYGSGMLGELSKASGIGDDASAGTVHSPAVSSVSQRSRSPG